MDNKNTFDISEHYASGANNKCSICGAPIKSRFYKNKPLCYSCWKRQLKGRNKIQDIKARLNKRGV